MLDSTMGMERSVLASEAARRVPLSLSGTHHSRMMPSSAVSHPLLACHDSAQRKLPSFALSTAVPSPQKSPALWRHFTSAPQPTRCAARLPVAVAAAGRTANATASGSASSANSHDPPRIVDLRSDTVTQPTAAMRRAMADAEVGDDVIDVDPTVERLQAEVAAMLGKEAGLLVPSGTMGNLICVLTHCQERGSEVILGSECHIFRYEQGGVAALGGVHPHPVRTLPDGTLPLREVEAAVRQEDDHYPATRLVCLENSHNRCGGRAITAEYTAQLGALAQRHGIPMHIDGARLFNAAVALGVSTFELVRPADSVSVCLSKGLGAPVGSVIVGRRDFIRKARRLRKALGGGMRQAGVLAAAGLVALVEGVPRLQEDHWRARRLAGWGGERRDCQMREEEE